MEVNFIEDRGELYQMLSRAKDNHSYFCANFLKIANKAGEQQNFTLNEIQLDFLDKLRRWTGKTKKIVVLKGRQFGMSTLIESIFFRRTIFNSDKRTLVIAHNQMSTDTIFEMTKYFYRNLPDYIKAMFPLEKSNAKELVFQGTGSTFKITGTGTPDKVRAQRNNYVHCSEVAFWRKPDEIISALDVSVKQERDNIIIFESTANGYNFFKQEFEKGLSNDMDSPVKSVFYGWDKHKEYSTEIPLDVYGSLEGFEESLTKEEKELKKVYELSLQQIYWRRQQIRATFQGREHLFQQEFPLCWQEAFLPPSVGLIPLIEIEKIIKARKQELKESEFAPVVVGVDPARMGLDRTAITVRKGRKILSIYTLKDKTAPEIEGFIIYNLLNSSLNIDMIFVDAGYGLDIVDHIRELGYKKIKAVFFNGKPNNPDLYVNRRSEMADAVRKWFYQEGGVDIKDNDEVCNEYSVIPDLEVNALGKLCMVPKEEIKELNLNNSPDYFDSLALTFAEPVVKNEEIGGAIKVEW